LLALETLLTLGTSRTYLTDTIKRSTAMVDQEEYEKDDRCERCSN